MAGQWRPDPTGSMLAFLYQRLSALQQQCSTAQAMGGDTIPEISALDDAIWDVWDDIAIITKAALLTEYGTPLRAENGHVIVREGTIPRPPYCSLPTPPPSQYLTDDDGNYILTSDGQRIKVY